MINHHTFNLYVDLRHAEITETNKFEVIAKLLRNAADRLDADQATLGGFHAPDKHGWSYDGGFWFDNHMFSRPKLPPKVETEKIEAAVKTGGLTRFFTLTSEVQITVEAETPTQAQEIAERALWALPEPVQAYSDPIIVEEAEVEH